MVSLTVDFTSDLSSPSEWFGVVTCWFMELRGCSQNGHGKDCLKFASFFSLKREMTWFKFFFLQIKKICKEQ